MAEVSSEAADRIVRRLVSMADEEYRVFQSKLVPNIEGDRILGVRIPAMRAYAKELIAAGKQGDASAEAFMNALPHYYQEEYILHALLLNEERDLNRLLPKIEALLPYVDNWAVCDTLKPKIFSKRRGELWELIPGWLGSEHVYTSRFGMGMLMAHFLDGDFNDRVLPMAGEAAKAHAGIDRYSDMMAAWFFATALAKQYDSTLEYMKTAELPEPMLGMTVRKARESFSVSNEQKEEISRLFGSGAKPTLYILGDALKNRIDGIAREADEVSGHAVRFEEFIALPYFGRIILRFTLDREDVSLDTLDGYENMLYGLVGDEFLIDFMGSDYRKAGVDIPDPERRFAELAAELTDEPITPSVHAEGIRADAKRLLKAAGLGLDERVWEIQPDEDEWLLLIMADERRSIKSVKAPVRMSVEEVPELPCVGLVKAAFYARRKGVSLARVLSGKN